MDDLTLVGVHDDGEHVLLTGPDGRRFRLRVDDALRAAVRRDRARLGQLQLEMDGKLRPRDVQARIRAGHTAEEIADEARVPLAYVRRYEGPVLAEREYVADQARAAVVRRGHGGEPTSLAQVVTERLARRGIEPDTVHWDAWRSDDGSWVVAADYPGQDARPAARWSFDQANRHVTALDDAARLLSAGEDQPPAAVGPRRLAPVQGLEVDAPSAWIDLPDPSSPADLLDTLTARRGRRSRAITPDEEGRPGSDPVREAIDSLLERSEAQQGAEPGRNHPAGRGGGRRPAQTGPRPNRPAQRAGEPDPVPPAPAPDVVVLPEPDGLLPISASPNPDDAEDHSPPGRKRGRASVPSWDDIVFGSRRD